MNKKKKCDGKLYTTGEINRIIDSVLHPFYEENQLLRLVDGVMHAAVERNVMRSARKFAKYNLRDVARIILRKELKKR